jgi:hypothetical protein
VILSLLMGFAGSIAACGLCAITCTGRIGDRRPDWTTWPLLYGCLLLNVSGWLVALLTAP